MPHLYVKEYTRHLIGKRIAIACREGILRDQLGNIISDIKFLNRHGIFTTLFHNLPNRLANQKIVTELEKKLPDTELVRIPPDVDFYHDVLASADIQFKLIFLERQCLHDKDGNKINTLTSSRFRSGDMEMADFVNNVNFRDALTQICEKIESGACERVHILQAGKGSIKEELFSVEGSGTMIADNFTEEFRQVSTEQDVKIVERILSMYKRSGYLKPRPKGYVEKYYDHFFVTAIDSIVVGCVETKEIDRETVELGALAISTRFRNQRIGVFTVSAFIAEMRGRGYVNFISMTRNPRLQELLLKMGFALEESGRWPKRREMSPGVPMYFKTDMLEFYP